MYNIVKKSRLRVVVMLGSKGGDRAWEGTWAPHIGGILHKLNHYAFIPVYISPVTDGPSIQHGTATCVYLDVHRDPVKELGKNFTEVGVTVTQRWSLRPGSSLPDQVAWSSEYLSHTNTCVLLQLRSGDQSQIRVLGVE